MDRKLFFLDPDRERDFNLLGVNLLRERQATPDFGKVMVVSIHYKNSDEREVIPISAHQPFAGILETIRIAAEFGAELDLGSLQISQVNLSEAIEQGVIDEFFE